MFYLIILFVFFFKYLILTITTNMKSKMAPLTNLLSFSVSIMHISSVHVVLKNQTFGNHHQFLPLVKAHWQVQYLERKA